MINKLVLIVFVLTSILLLIDELTPVDIDSLQLSAWLLVVAAATGATYLGRIFFHWKTAKTSAVFIALTIFLSFARYFMVWGGDWKTQNIIYRNRYSANRSIEYQMQNPGPGSYNQRTVDKTQLLPGISWLREFDTNSDAILESTIDIAEWKKVDIEVNELGLKYP